MSQLRATDEQTAAIDAFAAGGNVVLEAGAGTGKTSTLRMIAGNAAPGARGLYLAFNKSVQREAEGTFPGSVTAVTANALAYRATMRGRENRLPRGGKKRMTASQQADALGIVGPTDVGGMRVRRDSLARAAMNAVRAYVSSVDDEIGPQHVTDLPKGLAGRGTAGIAAYHEVVVSRAKQVWADLMSVDGVLPFWHDVYVKQWALTRPQLPFDFLLYDEAQDADPVVLSVVLGQNDIQTIAVGDQAQAIYGWRGAIDSMDLFDGVRCQLTQSWRFGAAIADEANVWLDLLDSPLRLRGNPALRSTVASAGGRSDAVLCRSNGGMIGELIRAQQLGVKVALAGEGKKELRALVEAAGKLKDGHFPSHPDLNGFVSWAALLAYTEDDPEGADLALLVSLVDRHTARAIVRALDHTVPADEADSVISTGHTAKGLEWGRVRISTDFHPPKVDRETGQLNPLSREEAMLAYVCTTRAQQHLNNSGLAWVHSTPGLVCEPRIPSTPPTDRVGVSA